MESQSAQERVEAVLGWLEERHYLSEERFVESRVRARAQRYGNQRIRLELRAHGVALSTEAEQMLRTSELDRAGTVRARKFGGDWPANALERCTSSSLLGRARIFRRRDSAFVAAPGGEPEVESGLGA